MIRAVRASFTRARIEEGARIAIIRAVLHERARATRTDGRYVKVYFGRPPVETGESRARAPTESACMRYTYGSSASCRESRVDGSRVIARYSVRVCQEPVDPSLLPPPIYPQHSLRGNSYREVERERRERDKIQGNSIFSKNLLLSACFRCGRRAARVFLSIKAQRASVAIETNYKQSTLVT